MSELKNKVVYLVGTFFLLCFSNCSLVTPKNKERKQPNIIYILADDLGYGELGCYGQEKIETPNIDNLAKEGVIFTQHYSGAPVCAPSRCVLLTGKHPGHAQIRGNDEWTERGDVWNYFAQVKDSTLEGQFPLKEDTKTIASLLKSAGYTTVIVGKWGLGAPHTHATPLQMGFDFFVGYNCQRQAHTYYPVHLYKNDKRILLGNDTISPVKKLNKGADPYKKESYADFNLNTYSADIMFEELQKFITDNDPNVTGKPLFMYWATPLPHVPLQAPERWVKHYVDIFGDEKPYLGNQGYFPQRYPRAAYAAMVSYMDEQVGQLVKQLKEQGIYDNTLIVFTSDNGPTFNGGTQSPWFKSGGPFRSEYGWGKCFVHEGGIRVPMIASWPGKIQAGSKTDHISAFWDVLPTFCEVADASIPDDVDGISLLPTLMGEDTQKEHEYLYWEFPELEGEQAVRMGDWKAIRRNIKKGNLDIELYNLKTDIQELNDVAAENPSVVEKVELIMKKEHVPSDNEHFQLKELGD
ncbi:MAG: arylsulfatase [Marinilabiliaceae bacterium]|nr:arylsulfatase [Marinilabiliaceae bacterium]